MRKRLSFLLLMGAMALSTCIRPGAPAVTPFAPPASPSPQITPTLRPQSFSGPYLIVEIAMIVRSGAGTGYPVTGQIQPGQKYRVLGRHTDWWLIDLGNERPAWANDVGSLTRLVGSVEAVPEIAATLMPTPTPRPACTDVSLADRASRGLERARSVLVHFFDLLSQGEYEKAAALYGGDYQGLQDWNPLIDPREHVTLITHACEINGLACLPVKRIVDERIVSSAEYQFTLEFMNEDGSLFVLGPCCGGNATDNPPISQFHNRVIRDCTGKFLVMYLYP